VVNNSYLGLIRQAQRSLEMDYSVQLAFDNVNSPELDDYGVDHVKVAEGLGLKALRVRDPDELGATFEKAVAMMAAAVSAARLAEGRARRAWVRTSRPASLTSTPREELSSRSTPSSRPSALMP
jgi:thiamine pyrophosphate-dependent acetolactate synthase large subunit-like protein